MSLIEFNGDLNTPIFIAQSKIVALERRDEETTFIFISVGHTTDRWVVREPLRDARIKYDNAI